MLLLTLNPKPCLCCCSLPYYRYHNLQTHQDLSVPQKLVPHGLMVIPVYLMKSTAPAAATSQPSMVAGMILCLPLAPSLAPTAKLCRSLAAAPGVALGHTLQAARVTLLLASAPARGWIRLRWVVLLARHGTVASVGKQRGRSSALPGWWWQDCLERRQKTRI